MINSYEAITATMSIKIVTHSGVGYSISAMTGASMVTSLAMTLHRPNIVELRIVGTSWMATKKQIMKETLMHSLLIMSK